MYLEEMGLGEDESELDGSKASQRNAIAATAAMDRSGLMLQKWAMTVRICVFKRFLMRFFYFVLVC